MNYLYFSLDVDAVKKYKYLMYLMACTWLLIVIIIILLYTLYPPDIIDKS